MKETKRMVLRIFVGAEMVLVTFLYLCSSGGIPAVQHAVRQNTVLHEEIERVEADISSLLVELDERKNNPFYKESIARNELQMAYANETIYLIPKG